MKTQRFKYYVLLADMRTGSNLFETTIKQYDAFSCFGELFNPHFVGGPKKSTMPSLNIHSRDADPISAITQMIEENPETLPGFRLFSNHNPMVMNYCLADEACAKIILTRNALDSFVSLKIAKKTDQWKLQDLNKRKDATIEFSIDEFEQFLDQKNNYTDALELQLQRAGQTAFRLTYSDMADVNTFNGIAKFLGSDETLDALVAETKRQNPTALEDKVTNHHDMVGALRNLKMFENDRNTYIEPSKTRRSGVIHAGRSTPILYFPITFNPTDPTVRWMKNIENDGQPARTKMSSSDIQEWMITTPNRSVITCLEHPVERVYRAFNDRIIFLPSDKNKWVRRVLADQFDLEIPNWEVGAQPSLAQVKAANYSADVHVQNFIKFLGFIKGNLRGQTHAPVSPEWGSQYLAIERYHEWTVPTVVIMPDKRKQAFKALELTYGLSAKTEWETCKDSALFPLSQVYSPQIEQDVRIAYQDDYRKFGFQGWKPNS